MGGNESFFTRGNRRNDTVKQRSTIGRLLRMLKITKRGCGSTGRVEREGDIEGGLPISGLKKGKLGRWRMDLSRA